MGIDADNYAVLEIKGKQYKLPIKKASIGHDVIDISNLYNESGYCTYDPGFMSTASCMSAITYINGNEGILRHRGYDIADLTDNCIFEEVCYLLLYGALPNVKELEEFRNKLGDHYLLHDQLNSIFKGFKRSSHPMAIMVGAVGSLSAFYHDSLDIHDPIQRETAIMRIIAKVVSLATIAYSYTQGHAMIYPKMQYTYAENMLHMMFSSPLREYEIKPAISKAINKLFILHADHEQNASTSTVRLAGSSGANPFAVIAAGISSLWGPAHGGANEAVIAMLSQIGSKNRISQFIAKAKDKDDPFRLMGFGHRVYKNYDPRAAVLKSSCDEILSLLNIDDPLLEVAKELEAIALKDEYFIERKLFPNVDFYSGAIYQALGIPTRMFTVMFAVARTAGWIAQWKEMIEDNTTKIGRPRQLYVGEVSRKFISINKR